MKTKKDFRKSKRENFFDSNDDGLRIKKSPKKDSGQKIRRKLYQEIDDFDDIDTYFRTEERENEDENDQADIY